MAIIIDFESIYQEYYGTKPNYQDDFEDDYDSYDDIIEDWYDEDDDVNFEEWDDMFKELDDDEIF